MLRARDVRAAILGIRTVEGKRCGTGSVPTFMCEVFGLQERVAMQAAVRQSAVLRLAASEMLLPAVSTDLIRTLQAPQLLL
jgi:hypothetical protein